MVVLQSVVNSGLELRADTPSLPDELPLPSATELPIGSAGFILRVASGRFRLWVLAILLSEGLHALCGALLPQVLGRIIGTITRAGAEGVALAAVTRSVVLFAVLCGAELVFGRIGSAVQLRLAPRQRQYVARALFRYLHRHSHRFLTENFAGALAHRISETSHGVNQVMFATLTEFWPMSIVITVANVLLLRASPWLGAFTTTWSIAFIAASLYLARRTQPLSSAASRARSRTAGAVVDSVTNHATVRLFARLEHERERLADAQSRELTTVLRANLAMEQVRLFQFSASAVLKGGTVVLAVWLWERGQLRVGDFVMAVSLSLLVIGEVRNLSRRFLELFEALGNVSEGVSTIFKPHELADHSGALDHEIGRGSIEFSNVDFRYAEGANVFSGLSLTIPAGQRVGLVGLSGSGKSTFVSLLLRLYDPQAGTIRIDGHDLRSMTQDSLHRQVGLIPQDPTLFHRTLRENIRYGRTGASDQEVEQAARRAHAHEFIAAMPEQYDAMVGERGVKLSGGQRQRIAIARVMLKDAPLLVLDEATASLDSLTELAIQSALDDAMEGKTVVVIAHRLSTIAHLDRILVFSRGCVIEDGTHQELLAKSGGYAELWAAQSKVGDAA
ncbi:MAG: transporter ATP-binding protein [Polyangiaceae bacterium]|jgi:ATP-binding cassette subfamily B protein|nr:transporter ATP-binding protein [Polyangiaceae bacterium]